MDYGRVTAVDFVNVPSYHIADDVAVRTSPGQLRVAVDFGGAIYVQQDAASAGLTVTPQRYQELIALGREIKWALKDSRWARRADHRGRVRRRGGVHHRHRLPDRRAPIRGGSRRRSGTRVRPAVRPSAKGAAPGVSG